jgi:hypothetical protein
MSPCSKMITLIFCRRFAVFKCILKKTSCNSLEVLKNGILIISVNLKLKFQVIASCNSFLAVAEMH